MDFKILITLTLLATFGCRAAGRLIMKPIDTDIKVNHSTYFNCSTDLGSTANFWYHGTKFVYTGNAILEPYHERFKIDRNASNGTYIYNLIIHSVQPGDAGQYICAEDEGVGESYSVQLVVLDDDPICRSNRELDEVIGQNACNIEPDKVELHCSVTYHGNIPPQMEWRKVGDNSSTPLDVSVVISRNYFVSTLKLEGDIALNKSSYACETKRTTQEPNKCTSQVIKILYALSDNATLNKTINDEVHCNANTSQSCNYKWKWYEDNDVTTESSTSLLKARKSGWHRCDAECYLGNRTCNLLVMRTLVIGDTESSLTSTTIVYIVVGVTITLGVVGGLLFVFLRITRKRELIGKSGSPTEPVNPEENALLKVEHPDEAATLNEDITQGRLQYGREEFAGDRAVLNELLKQPVLAIYGLAVLGQEMFISRLQHPNIEVYDSTTFHFKRRMEVIGMTDPEHIVSCSVNNCLYTFDWNYQGQFAAMLRIDPTNGNLIKTWNINGRGGRLSIASDTNVILNVNYEAMLHEYRADGELIRKINLDSVRTGIFRSWHAIKLSNGQFVVCHGDYDDPLSRVCLLSIKTTASTLGRTDEVEILKAFGAEPGESIDRLKQPIYLSVDKNGSILVSDKKTVLLSSNFDKPQIIVSEEHGLEKSWRTCFDESTGNWSVADYHRVMVCQMKDEKVKRKLHNLISR